MLYQKIIPSLKDYDAVICGGGFSGFAAAFASAREGLKTVIIEEGVSQLSSSIFKGCENMNFGRAKTRCYNLYHESYFAGN